MLARPRHMRQRVQTGFAHSVAGSIPAGRTKARYLHPYARARHRLWAQIAGEFQNDSTQVGNILKHFMITRDKGW